MTNIFIGKFRVVAVYGNVREKGWTLFKRYKKDGFLWEFAQEKKMKFPSGKTGYEGTLQEYFPGPKEITGYRYCPKDKLLFIDRSYNEPSGPANISMNENYRVVWVCYNSYWLYDLRDVVNEPHDYRFRIKLRRIVDKKP